MLLKKHVQDYDYILIDCAPTDTVLTTMALRIRFFTHPDATRPVFSSSVLPISSKRLTFNNSALTPTRSRCSESVFTQMFSTVVEMQAVVDTEKEAKKSNIPVFQSTLHYSQSFARSVAERSPIFATRNAHYSTRMSIGKIAVEAKKYIAAAQSGMVANNPVPQGKKVRRRTP